MCLDVQTVYMFIVSRVAGTAIMSAILSPLVYTVYSDVFGQDPEDDQFVYLTFLFIVSVMADQWMRDNS